MKYLVATLATTSTSSLILCPYTSCLIAGTAVRRYVPYTQLRTSSTGRTCGAKGPRPTSVHF
eukprot:scaffold146575_cov40-Prasinocladus_malaysianus.AAC.3